MADKRFAFLGGFSVAVAHLALPGSLVLAALMLPGGAATDIVGNVTNVAPVVVSVTLPGASINPTAGTTTSVATTIVVQDVNGYQDVAGVTVEVLKPDGSTSHIAAAAATLGSNSNATDATWTRSFNMNFYDDAALTTSTYKVKVVATDAGGLQGTNTASLAVFNFNQLVAMNLAAGTLDYGASLDPGTTSTTKNFSIQNYGNVQLDIQVSGTNLTHSTESASIVVGYMNYSLSSDMSGKASLSTSAATLSSFDLVKGASSSKPTYWALTVPSGADQWVPAGTYTGTITVGAVSG